MGGRGASSFSGAKKTRGHLEGIHNDAKEIEFVQNELGVSEKKARSLHHAVKEWTRGSYLDIRGFQQGAYDADWAGHLSSDLEEYISLAPKWDGGTTYRGIDNLTKDQIASLSKPGQVINMQGTSSWSSRKTAAEAYAYNHGIVFVCDTQKRGTSIQHISQSSSENEVVVSKSSAYKVTKKKRDYRKEIVYVYVEEV